MKRGNAWLAMVLAATAAAQEKKALPLSLTKAVEIATAPDGAARVRLATEAVKQAEARKDQVRAALLPNVDASYTYRNFTNNLQAFGFTFSRIPGFQISPFIGPLGVSDYRATASQSIFDLSAIRRYQASRLQVSASKSEESVALNQTKGAVAKAYLNAVRSEAELDAARANVALAERLLRQAQSQKEAGTGTGIEIVRAQVTLANEKQRQIVAEEDRKSSYLQLLRSMNLELAFEPELTDRMEYTPAEIPEPAKALAAAQELRPELKAQSERQRSAQLNYDAAKWERLPSVQAFGDYGTIGETSVNLLPTRTVGVTVKVPVWDGGRRDARRAESASLLRQEGIRTRDTSQQVELEIRLAIEALKSAESQVVVATEALGLAERELAQAERRFGAGVATGLEVTDAQTRVSRARENKVSALFRQKAARVDLGVAVGNIDMVLQ